MQSMSQIARLADRSEQRLAHTDAQKRLQLSAIDFAGLMERVGQLAKKPLRFQLQVSHCHVSVSIEPCVTMVRDVMKRQLEARQRQTAGAAATAPSGGSQGPRRTNSARHTGAGSSASGGTSTARRKVESTSLAVRLEDLDGWHDTIIDTCFLLYSAMKKASTTVRGGVSAGVDKELSLVMTGSKFVGPPGMSVPIAFPAQVWEPTSYTLKFDTLPTGLFNVELLLCRVNDDGTAPEASAAAPATSTPTPRSATSSAEVVYGSATSGVQRGRRASDAGHALALSPPPSNRGRAMSEGLGTSKDGPLGLERSVGTLTLAPAASAPALGTRPAPSTPGSTVAIKDFDETDGRPRGPSVLSLEDMRGVDGDSRASAAADSEEVARKVAHLDSVVSLRLLRTWVGTRIDAAKVASAAAAAAADGKGYFDAVSVVGTYVRTILPLWLLEGGFFPGVWFTRFPRLLPFAQPQPRGLGRPVLHGRLYAAVG